MSILHGKPKMMRSATILVPKESYLFLKNRNRESRGFEPLTEKANERFWNRSVRKEGDEARIDFDSFGWDVSYIKGLLEEAGLPYRDDGVQIESISI